MHDLLLLGQEALDLIGGIKSTLSLGDDGLVEAKSRHLFDGLRGATSGSLGLAFGENGPRVRAFVRGTGVNPAQGRFTVAVLAGGAIGADHVDVSTLRLERGPRGPGGVGRLCLVPSVYCLVRRRVTQTSGEATSAGGGGLRSEGMLKRNG